MRLPRLGVPPLLGVLLGLGICDCVPEAVLAAPEAALAVAALRGVVGLPFAAVEAAVVVL